MYEKCLAAGARYREGKFHSVILTVVIRRYHSLTVLSDMAISRQYKGDDAAQRQSTTSSIPNSSTAISGAAFPVARSTTKTLGARPTVKSV